MTGDMGAGPGTMGLSLAAFLVIWVVMMAAMMFPSVAPMAAAWIRIGVGAPDPAARASSASSTFLGGYLVAWAAFGALVYVVLSRAPIAWSARRRRPRGGREPPIFAVAGIYQLTPLKSVCLRHCRSPLGIGSFHYASYSGPGARPPRRRRITALYCVGCCWGLMILLVAVGAMNIPAMVALAGVIFLEKVWRHGAGFAVAVGVVLLAAAVFTVFSTTLVPGLREPMAPMVTAPPASPDMGGM